MPQTFRIRLELAGPLREGETIEQLLANLEDIVIDDFDHENKIKILVAETITPISTKTVHELWGEK